MDRHERKQLQEFVDSYDRGTAGEGIKAPQFVIEGLRELVANAKADDIPECRECQEEATWEDAEGRTWCDAHPYANEPPNDIWSAFTWRDRYLRLRAACEGGMQVTTHQELRQVVDTAIHADEL